MTENLKIDPDFIKRLEQRAEVQELLDADDRAHVIVQTADGALRLRAGVPVSRDECPTRRTAQGLRLCGYVRCSHHLALTADDGRPWNGPRNTLRPFWLEPVTPATCGLDLAEEVRAEHQRGLSTKEMARIFRCHPTLVRRRVKEGLQALKKAGVNVQAWQLVIDEEERDATNA